jgi:hypothetical protein
MKKLPPVALVATGKLMRSFILDLPGFRERIGPVKAASLRVASRITNTLQAGFPVADYEALQPCPMIFICVSDGMLPETIQELGDSLDRRLDRGVLETAGRSAADALGQAARHRQ